MRRTPLPKISIFIIILASLMTTTVFGQTKPSGEVDVTKCWTYSLGEETGVALASDGNRVFLGLGNSRVEELSIDGKKMWSTELGGDISSNILALAGGLFIVTSVSSDVGRSAGGVLRNLSKETGITNWTLKLPDAEKHFLGGFNGSLVIVSKSGVIQSVDTQNGKVKWRREITEGFAAEPAFEGGKVIVATIAKQIFVVSLASGEIDSMRKVPYGITAIGKIPSADIVAGDDRGNLSSLVSGSEKPYWSFKSGGEISSVFTVGEHLVVTSHDNFVYFLLGRNGGLVWKKRLTGRVAQISTYADHFALITSIDDHGSILVDLSNGKVAGQIALSEDENLVEPPVVSNGLIFVLTNKAAYGFCLNGCPVMKNGGPGK